VNLAPWFAPQFHDDDGTLLSGGFLFTYVSGTTSPQDTYQDQAGVTPNSQPIELDDRGECLLFLDPALVYTFKLCRSDLSEIWTRDNIQAGAVDAVSQADLDALTAGDIGYTTGTSTTWFVGSDIGAALDALIERADAIPAASVTLADSGSLYTATDAEGALAEVRTALNALSTSGRLLRTSYFSSSGTWTKASDVGFIVAEGVGGGASSTADGKMGGGAGGYARKKIAAASLGATETVTVGAGGAAGGTAGADTTFGAHFTAGGGQIGTVVGSAGNGGVGGAASGGDLNLNGGGGGGTHGGTDESFGAGGNSYFGGGARGSGGTSVPAGFAGAPNTGGGGGGGTAAAGGSGLVIVYEYS
jgi:hypothetical protein